MRSTRLAFVAASILFALTLGLAQEKVDPKSQPLVDALLKVLPEYEAAADGFEKALEPYLKSTDPKIVASVDSVRLQILAIRSVRKIIKEQPSYLQYHISTANLIRWKEGAAPPSRWRTLPRAARFLCCTRSGPSIFGSCPSMLRASSHHARSDIP